MRSATLCLFVLFACLHLNSQPSIDNLKQQLKAYDSARGSTVSLKDTIKLNLLTSLSKLSSETNPAQALIYANQQLNLAKMMRYNKGIADAYDNLGFINQSQGNFSAAISYFTQMLELNRKLNNKVGQTSASNALGQVYGETSNSEEALKYFLHALELSKRLGDKKGVASGYNNIGVVYRKNRENDKALSNYLTAEKILLELDNKPALAMVNHNIGQIYWTIGDDKKAIQSMKKGLQIAQEIHDVRAEFRNWNGLGFVYGDMGETDLALKCFNEALQINQRMGNLPGIVDSNLSIGRVYFQKSQFDKALEYGIRGLKLSIESDDIEQKSNAYDLLYKTYEEKKDFEKALEYFALYNVINDSIYNVQKSENLEKLKLRYDIKSAQDSIAGVQSKKDLIAKESARTQRNTRNFIVVGMSMLVIFLVILLWQRNKMAIVKRHRALEQERNRISRDLHDNLGAQLSTVRMFVSSLKKKNNQSTFIETVDSSIGMLDSSIGELRVIMHEMHNHVLVDKGFLVATEELVNRVNKLHSVVFTLSTHNLEERPRPDLEHQLYRVTQELVNNTLKYANAKKVSIDVLRRDRNLVLMYEDDGVGFNPNTIKKGYGLNNIEIRSNGVGGKVEFDSMPGAGARTTVEIPE